MGFFNRKKDRVYSLSEAMKLLQTKKYENYTTIPEENGYRLVPMQEQIVYSETEGISYGKEKRNRFVSRLAEQVDYNETNKLPNYNNYQSAKNYKANQGVSR